MIVVDASVLAPALADDGDHGAAARRRLRGADLVAPQVIDLEVVSVLRRLTHAGELTVRRAKAAMDDLIDLPLQRADHLVLLPRCWELRDSVTPYDAAYVAVAEALDAVLLTADRRLARAHGPRCIIELIEVEQST